MNGANALQLWAMKKSILSAFSLLLAFSTISFSAHAAGKSTRLPLEVLKASYNPTEKIIEMDVRYRGGCGERKAIVKNGCTDLYFPYTCIYTVYVATENSPKSCHTVIEGKGYIPAEELQLDFAGRFKWVNIELRGNKTKTSQQVELDFRKYPAP